VSLFVSVSVLSIQLIGPCEKALDIKTKTGYNFPESSGGASDNEGDGEGMISIVCDSCRKQITDPVRRENFFTILHKELCRDCYKKLLLTVEDTMEANRPQVTLDWHNRELVANLNRMTR